MKNIYVLTGMSGVGKTTIINELSKTGLFIYPKMYTTRPVRERIKDGKIHVTEEDYKNISSKVVEFCYNQYKYAITDKEVQRANIFDLAPSGFRSLQENYNGPKKIVIIYIWIDEKERINRMKKREENEQNILSRLEYEKSEYNNIEEIVDYSIINDSLTDCVDKIMEIIKLNEN